MIRRPLMLVATPFGALTRVYTPQSYIEVSFCESNVLGEYNYYILFLLNFQF